MIPRSRTPIARKPRAPIKRSRIKKRPRKKSETLRIYGPPGYVEWIHEQPCIACGVVGFSECAHIKTGGTGRKSDWTWTIPLCGRRFGVLGCHCLYDEYRLKFATRFPTLDVTKAALEITERWLRQKGNTKVAIDTHG